MLNRLVNSCLRPNIEAVGPTNLEHDVLVGVGEVEVRRLDDLGRLLCVDHDGQRQEDLRQRPSLDPLDPLILINLF